jgi:hypothetical protein
MGAWHCENACFPQKYDFSQDWGKNKPDFLPKTVIFGYLGRKTHRIPPQKLIFPEISGENMKEFPPKTQIFENLGENMKDSTPKNSNFREFGGKHRYPGTEFLCKKITPATTGGRP